MTTSEVATRFDELAKQEKWFEIQDELFADNIKSIEPVGSAYMGYAEGKQNVREKAQRFLKNVEAVHGAHTTASVVGGDYFAVGREMDLTVRGFGRIQLNQVMLYEVKDGRIISEQFFIKKIRPISFAWSMFLFDRVMKHRYSHALSWYSSL